MVGMQQRLEGFKVFRKWRRSLNAKMFNFSNFFSLQFWTAPELRTKQNKEDEVHKISFDPSGWTKMQAGWG